MPHQTSCLCVVSSLVLIVVFVVWGKSLPHWQTLSAEEKATLTFFALTNLGLLLAWFSSFWGAMLSFVSIIIFMVVSHGIYINLEFATFFVLPILFFILSAIEKNYREG